MKVGTLGMLEQARGSIPTRRKISARDGRSHVGRWQVVVAGAGIFHHLGMVVHFGGRCRANGRVIRIISGSRLSVKVGFAVVVSVFMRRGSTLKSVAARQVEHAQNGLVCGVRLRETMAGGVRRISTFV